MFVNHSVLWQTLHANRDHHRCNYFNFAEQTPGVVHCSVHRLNLNGLMRYGCTLPDAGQTNRSETIAEWNETQCNGNRCTHRVFCKRMHVSDNNRYNLIDHIIARDTFFSFCVAPHFWCIYILLFSIFILMEEIHDTKEVTKNREHQTHM